MRISFGRRRRRTPSNLTRWRGGGGGRFRRGAKDEFAVFGDDFNGIAALNIAAEEFFRERIFEIALDRAAHGARSVLRVVAFFNKEFFRAFCQLDVNFLRFDPGQNFFRFQIDNLEQLRFSELM